MTKRREHNKPQPGPQLGGITAGKTIQGQRYMDGESG